MLLTHWLVSLAARHWPFANGSGRLLDRYAGAINLGGGRRRAQSSDGFALDVLADDLIGRHILLSGKFDRSIVQVLLDQARPGDVLLDVGANIGYVSACFLQLVENSSAVCVEPQPQIVDLLSNNLSQFGSRATIYPVALTEETREIRFSINNVNRGSSHIDEDGDHVVQGVSAGEFLKQLDKVDLVKIDVEGHEFSVLAAMEKPLERLSPRAIMFEDHTGSAHIGGPIGAILDRLGYDVFGIRKRLFKTELQLVRTAEDCVASDYIALR